MEGSTGPKVGKHYLPQFEMGKPLSEVRGQWLW